MPTPIPPPQRFSLGLLVKFIIENSVFLFQKLKSLGHLVNDIESLAHTRKFSLGHLVSPGDQEKTQSLLVSPGHQEKTKSLLVSWCHQETRRGPRVSWSHQETRKEPRVSWSHQETRRGPRVSWSSLGQCCIYMNYCSILNEEKIYGEVCTILQKMIEI